MCGEGSLEPAEWCWQQQSRVGNGGPVLISSAQSGVNLHLKGCACSACCCVSGSVLKATCTVLSLKHHGDGNLSLSQVLPEPHARGRSEQAGLYWQATAAPGWPSPQDPGDTLQLQSGLPCSLLFPVLFQVAGIPCPAAFLHVQLALCLQNCLARFGLDEGISQGLVEAEEGKISLVLSLSKALVFDSLLQARGQPAVALLRLWLNGLCKMALLILSLQSAERPVLCGDTHNTLAQQALQSIPVFGSMKCWECPARAWEVSSHTKVPQKHMHPTEDRARLRQI